MAAILIDVPSGTILSQFHQYVRPTFYPILSDYCVNLTGITQQHIDCQAHFPTVYAKFINWLQNDIRLAFNLSFATSNIRRTDFGCNTAFCSWTNWDFRTYLRTDCKRHLIEPLPCLKAWIDARKIFEVSVCRRILRSLKINFFNCLFSCFMYN